MGTDIHMRAEIRRGEGTVWEPVRSIFRYTYYDPYTDDLDRATSPEPYDGRNYTLFAALAGVRNGVGFAGVPTHRPITPLDEPRGLPLDVAHHRLSDGTYFDESEDHDLTDAEWEAMRPSERRAWTDESWIFGEHSMSYATVQELLDYDWDQPLPRTGVVTAEQYAHLRTEPNAAPNTWSGSVSGGGIVTLSAEQAEAEIAAGKWQDVEPVEKADPFGSFGKLYVQYDWTETLRSAIGESWFQLLDDMKRWGGYGRGEIKHSDKRLVFGFDS